MGRRRQGQLQRPGRGQGWWQLKLAPERQQQQPAWELEQAEQRGQRRQPAWLLLASEW